MHKEGEETLEKATTMSWRKWKRRKRREKSNSKVRLRTSDDCITRAKKSRHIPTPYYIYIYNMRIYYNMNIYTILIYITHGSAGQVLHQGSTLRHLPSRCTSFPLPRTKRMECCVGTTCARSSPVRSRRARPMPSILCRRRAATPGSMPC